MMNLQRAILLVLLASTRPIGARVIKGFLPGFIDGDFTEAQISEACADLKQQGEVNGAPLKDVGMLWQITPEGRLRIQ